MINLIIISFIISLIWLAKTEILKGYIWLLALQGILLFGVGLLELHDINILHLLLILSETLFFKAIFIPWFLRKLTKDVRTDKNSNLINKGFYSVIGAIVLVILSFVLAHVLHYEHLQVKYFAAAISSILVGLFIAITNRDLVIHFISFLVLENGIFLLSLALGSEMPMMVNTAILLDIFSSVLIMGMFYRKIKDLFPDTDTDHLTQLKD